MNFLLKKTFKLVEIKIYEVKIPLFRIRDPRKIESSGVNYRTQGFYKHTIRTSNVNTDVSKCTRDPLRIIP